MNENDYSEVFRGEPEVSILTSNRRLSGKSKIVSLTEGRDLIKANLRTVSKSEWLLCIQELPRKYFRLLDNSGMPSYKSGEIAFKLWQIPDCSFNDSLSLIDYFGFLQPQDDVPLEILALDTENDLKDKKTREHLVHREDEGGTGKGNVG